MIYQLFHICLYSRPPLSLHGVLPFAVSVISRRACGVIWPPVTAAPKLFSVRRLGRAQELMSTHQRLKMTKLSLLSLTRQSARNSSFLFRNQTKPILYLLMPTDSYTGSHSNISKFTKHTTSNPVHNKLSAISRNGQREFSLRLQVDRRNTWFVLRLHVILICSFALVIQILAISPGMPDVHSAFCHAVQFEGQYPGVTPQ